MTDREDSRPVYGEPRHAWLDWLRCASIVLVLGSHYQVDWWDAGLFQPVAMFNMRLGWSGVDFFFAISGFLIGNLLLGEVLRYGQLDTSRFYFRRAAKIWPLYYLTCAVYLFCAPLLFDQTLLESLRGIGPSLFHIQNYAGAARGMGHFWSLAVEEHFYLLLPIVIAAVARLQDPRRVGPLMVRFCAGTILAVLLLRITYVALTGATASEVRAFTHFRIDALLCGVLLAVVYRIWPDVWGRLRARRGVLAMAAFAGLVTFAFNPNNSLFVATVGYTSIQLLYCSIIVFASQFDGARVLPVLRKPLQLAAWVGRHSYPIYLFHPFIWMVEGPIILPMMEDTGFAEQSLVWLAGYIVFVSLAVGVGVVIGEILEKPLLRLRNRLVPPRNMALERPATPDNPHPAPGHLAAASSAEIDIQSAVIGTHSR